MKFARKYPKDVFKFLMEMKESTNEWEIRIIAVTLLSHFLNDEYIRLQYFRRLRQRKMPLFQEYAPVHPYREFLYYPAL